MNYVFMQCCSPFNLIAEKSEMVKAVKDQENRESIIFYFLREGCIRQTLLWAATQERNSCTDHLYEKPKPAGDVSFHQLHGNNII